MIRARRRRQWCLRAAGQVMVIPISEASVPYARSVRAKLRAALLHVDVDDSDKKMQKKVREAQLAQYNYILVRAPSRVLTPPHPSPARPMPSCSCFRPGLLRPAWGMTCGFINSVCSLTFHPLLLQLLVLSSIANLVMMHVLFILPAWQHQQRFGAVMGAGGGGEGGGGGNGECAHARQCGARHARAGGREAGREEFLLLSWHVTLT